MERNNIFNLDCLDGMRQLPDNTVDLTVTSPPYDSIRVYNGFSFDFESIAKELYRVTKPGGVVVWVVGDATKNGSESGTSFRQALYFKEIGFNLHDTMIFQKTNYVPLTHNRYEQAFEYMFILSKGKPKTFNPLKVPCKTVGNPIHRKQGYNGAAKETGAAMRRNNTRDEITVVKSEKNKSNIWEYTIGGGASSKDKIAFQHPAIFPEQLALDHILSWSNPGELVMDIFSGSGTTAKMAALNSRDFIAFELSADYCSIAEQRLKDALANQQALQQMELEL
jgi:site-specific DNA-methyltransferase (adenine-specific)